MNRLVPLAMLAALAAGCASMGPDARAGWKQTVVEAEGWSPLVGDDLLSAKKRALMEAQKKAVEKAVGVTVRADTRVENAVAMRQSITANMGGTIRRYDILSEGASDGFMKVKIRASVLYRPAADRTPMKATRFFVNVAGGGAAAALRRELASWDFPVVESAADADVVVTGVVETFGLADARLGGLYSYKARVSLDVADVPSGELTKQVQEASFIDVDDRTACDAALDKAGSMAGLDLAARYSGKSAGTTAAAKW